MMKKITKKRNEEAEPNSERTENTQIQETGGKGQNEVQ